MKRFIPSILVLCALPAFAQPISFSDLKFIDTGMSQAEVYLRVGEPDYIVPTQESKIVTRYDNNRHEKKGRYHNGRYDREVTEYESKSDAVWYGKGSIPATIITFKNGKVQEVNSTRAKAYFQKTDNMIIMTPN